MKTTIKDIAKASGYSYATVARVLSDQPGVKQETKLKILGTMERLGYRTQLCQSIKGKLKKSNILVIVDDITIPFYADLIMSITETLQKYDYMVTLGISAGYEKLELKYMEQVEETNISGVIMVTVTDSEKMRQLLVQTKVPVVLVNRYMRSVDLDAVCIDNLRGGYMAGEYLASLGHKKICHLAGPSESNTSHDRTRGFEEAMRDAKIDFDISRDVFYGDLKYDGGYRLGKEYIGKRMSYTAIFCGNDVMAKGFADAIKEYGKSVPEDISVICFDNTTSAASGNVKFTTVWQEPRVMGAMAANMLIERLTMQRTEPFKMIYPPQLLIRNSCARPK